MRSSLATVAAAVTAAVVISTAAPVVVPITRAASAQVSSSGPTLTPPSGGATTTTLPPPAKAELVVDLNTGRILLDHNAHAQLPPASLTKLVTALIATNWLAPQHRVWVSSAAANVYPDKVGMKAGQVWPLQVVLRALLIDSANDAAYALAGQISRSVARFGPLMAAAAAQMGMTDHPVFHDPAGLDGSEGYKGGNTMSAWDVAIAARDVLANATLRSIVGTRRYTFKGPDGIVYALSNKNHYFLDTYPGAIGVKTGFTDPAGLCIAAAATRGGRTLLAVVLNGASTYQTAEDLLNQGFAIPARSEPKSAPVLPPVREPKPPPKPAPTTTTVTTSPSDPPHLAVGSLHSATRPRVRLTPLEGVDLAAIVLAAGLIVLQFRRRRRKRPAGAHSRASR